MADISVFRWFFHSEKTTDDGGLLKPLYFHDPTTESLRQKTECISATAVIKTGFSNFDASL